MVINGIGDWFYFVGQQWISSLQVFFPKNFKLFALVTLNALFQAWKVVLKYFWWVFLIYPVLNIIPTFKAQLYINALPGLLLVFISYLFFCAIRPSLTQKNMHYFIDYIPHALFFLLYAMIFLFFFGFIFTIPSFIYEYFKNMWILAALLYGLVLLFSLVVKVGMIFGFFFFLDNKISMKACFNSIIRGLKMAFYGLPFCALVVLFISCLAVIVASMDRFVANWYFVGPLIIMVSNSLMISFQLCILNTFYIKRAHEDNELYFRQSC